MQKAQAFCMASINDAGLLRAGSRGSEHGMLDMRRDATKGSRPSQQLRVELVQQGLAQAQRNYSHVSTKPGPNTSEYPGERESRVFACQ